MAILLEKYQMQLKPLWNSMHTLFLQWLYEKHYSNLGNIKVPP
jgi:hypothetical protein